MEDVQALCQVRRSGFPTGGLQHSGQVQHLGKDAYHTEVHNPAGAKDDHSRNAMELLHGPCPQVSRSCQTPGVWHAAHSLCFATALRLCALQTGTASCVWAPTIASPARLALLLMSMLHLAMLMRRRRTAARVWQALPPPGRASLPPLLHHLLPQSELSFPLTVVCSTAAQELWQAFICNELILPLMFAGLCEQR